MEQEQQKEVEELEKVSAHIGEVKECRMCKYVLLFSFMMLLAVMVIVYVQKEKMLDPSKQEVPSSFHSIPPTKEQQASTSAEFNQRVLELGQTAFGSGVTPSVSTENSVNTGVPTTSTRIPDGPPPILE